MDHQRRSPVGGSKVSETCLNIEDLGNRNGKSGAVMSSFD